MKNCAFVLGVFSTFLFAFFSCSPKEESSVLLPELQQAEAIMYQYPDSALKILEQMPVPPASDRLQHATWCLLMAQAKYKNGLDQSLDSLIDIAYDYFNEKDNSQRKGLSLYLKGALLIEGDNVEKSLQYYLEASKYAENTNDFQLKYLIYIGIGEIYSYRDFIDRAFQAYQEANRNAILSKNKLYISGSYRFLARVYMLRKDYREATKYYEMANEEASYTGNNEIICAGLNELSSAYAESQNLEKALSTARESLNLKLREKLGTDQISLTIGDIYRLVGKRDSAYYYLNSAKNSVNIYTARSAYQALSLLAKEEGNYKSAFDYNEKIQYYADSIQSLDRGKALVEIQEKYNQERVINEKNQLIIDRDRIIRNALWGGVSLLSIMVLLTYVYQRKLVKKERKIQENEERIRLITLKIHENEALVSRNENRIKELLVEIELNQGIQEQVEELQEAISEIRNSNELLQQENELLQDSVSLYSEATKEKAKLLNSMKAQSEEVERLRERERFLCDQLVKKTDVLNKLKKSPRYLDVVQWESLREAIEFVYNDFTVRLKKDFPSLTEGELKICCLIKLHISVSDMGIILGISPTSVSRSKLRLKEHIIQVLGSSFEENQTLDLWIWEY